MNKYLLATTMMALLASPDVAEARKKKAPPPAPAPVVRVVPTDPVELYYYTHGDAPIWFRNDASRAAASRLGAILRRAPIDGFAAGPALAAQVDAAIASAVPGNAQAQKSAELALSKAWVAYMQHMRTAPKGMIYGYQQLAPHSRPDQILLTTAAAPDLAATLDRMADVNPTYRGLREAALASGMTAADARLLSNLERARVLPSTGRFILVDSGNAMLTMYENGQPVDRMKVIVGTEETPTPMIASVIHWITLNPYWNVPPNLIKKTIAPSAIKGGDAYLKRTGYEVMSGWGPDATVVPAKDVDWNKVLANPESVRVRQKPSALNSMGRLKVPFPSGQDIFLHDTPSKDKFQLANRQQSNGCIRLEDAKRLARWLMGSEPAMSGKDPEQFVQIPKGVPVYLTYLTVEAGADGKLAMRKDPYGWDGRPDLQLAAATMYSSVARPAP
ncbi:L,D-transpeptidase family protein [Sphingomonas sp. LHG3406-1]|uniref:L,D-transpeptidase family protein n=1 Tax=Sphingomonas sp. LHG3406-1 TaxID=2804617 RepID=UPI002604BA4C|nr:L,D-transpeptidase family protein [Sphingomonas sp. LHG3406-1]